MPTEVILPRVDMDMTEAIFAQWLVGEGDTVRQGDVIFEIETTKANMEVESPASGVIRYMDAKEGEEYDVGVTLAWIYGEGEADVPPPQNIAEPVSSNNDEAQPVPQNTELDTTVKCEKDVAVSEADLIEEDIRATPKVRRIAREKGIDLRRVKGSGPNGRIHVEDLLSDMRTGSLGNSILNSVWLTPAGGERVVVAIHGFSADAGSWQPLINSLKSKSQSISVLAIELPGHGGSAEVDVLSFDDMLNAVADTIAAAGVEQYHLLGHSLGGAVAIALAARDKAVQSKVRSLCLLAPAGLGPEINQGFIDGMLAGRRRESFVPWLRELLFDTDLLDSRFVDAVVEPLADEGVRTRRESLIRDCFVAGTQLRSLRDEVNALAVPLKVIWGVNDRILPVRHSDDLNGHVAVHRFRHCGHLPQLEARDEVAALLVELTR